MSLHARLRVEHLEARDVPATFGIPWPDGSHLTLSFARDGTQINGASSALFQQLGASAPDGWEREILRAYQIWAANANVNIGVVPDGGQSFGTAGAPQGDSRFGDIRVGARSLGPDVVAITAPYDPFGAWSGNVVLNTDKPISVGGAGGYDLYTTLLQEAGNALGIDNSTDPTSPMYEYYSGPRTGLTAGDIQNLQALYGPRKPDAYEGTAGNDTLARATPYRNALEADITTPTDVDVYKFTAPLLPLAMTVRLETSGVSLLTAKVSVLDSSGRLVGYAAVTDPLRGDVALPFLLMNPLGTYYIKVQANSNDVFGVGSYRLEVTQGVAVLLNNLSTLVTNLIKLPDPETLSGTNDSLRSATPLTVQSGASDTAIDFSTRASLARSSDVDYYKVQAPTAFASGGTTGALIVTAWGDAGDTPNLRVTVFSATGAALPARVLVQDDGTATVEVTGVAAGQTYFVRIGSGSGQTGDYRLAGDFRAAPVVLPNLASGTLTAAQPAVVTTLDLSQSSVCHFVLSSDDSATASCTTLTVTVRDESGQVVFSFTVAAGEARSNKVMLAAGRYTVSVSASTNGSLGMVPFSLDAVVETDPTGIQPGNPNGTPSQPGSGAPSGSTGSTYTGPTSTTSQPNV